MWLFHNGFSKMERENARRDSFILAGGRGRPREALLKMFSKVEKENARRDLLSLGKRRLKTLEALL